MGIAAGEAGGGAELGVHALYGRAEHDLKPFSHTLHQGAFTLLQFLSLRAQNHTADTGILFFCGEDKFLDTVKYHKILLIQDV